MNGNNKIAALRESLSTYVWMMMPMALHTSRDLLMQALATREVMSEEGYIGHMRVQVGPSPSLPLNGEETAAHTSGETLGTVAAAHTSGEALGTGAAEPDPHTCINVEVMDGDVLRNGGMCAIGSMDLKDHMREMTDAGVIGHVLVINSGGGTAQAVYDFIDAVEYAHAAGQPVVAFVRGMACSAAYFLAMLCDKVLTSSEHDIVGSIGVMVAGFFVRPDVENKYTLETYREVYADKSTMKNHAHREAMEGNMQPYIDGCNEMCEFFHQKARECRPNIKDEQLTGDHYDAIDVLGTLVDECGVTMEDAIDQCIIESRKRGTTIVK